ncbi:type IV pilin protein [Halomonas aestuarii]|uniref:type IV pilin protein n=1 Tax=Halomonas aestuarii TaxID=1897729 RepID=UPI0009FA7435|nr:type IV pilin protein [Halomonas aestuarii]
MYRVIFDTPRPRPQGPSGSIRPSAGFTLIELLIAVAVIGVLASIAYPSYTRYVQEARRTDAISALNNVAGSLERCYTVTNSYASAADGNACVSLPRTSEDEFYTVSAATLTASQFLLEASPQGVQEDDPCGTFTLNQQGGRKNENSGGTEIDACW